MYLFYHTIAYQNLNWFLATCMYSGLENLYFNVEMNFGLISMAKDFISSTASLRSYSL